MKIVHLTTVHPADDVRIYKKEVLALQTAGLDVTLVAPDSDAEKALQAPYVPLMRRKGRLNRMVNGPLEAYRKVKNTGAEVVHCHDPELMPLALLFKLLGKKVIFDVHEDYAEQILTKKYLPVYMRRPTAFFIQILERLCMPRFDLLITVVEPIRDKLIRYNKNTIIIRNYPKLSEFDKFFSETASESPQKKFAVYAGGLTEIRAAREMVKASEWAKVPLVLVGKVQDKTLQPLFQNLKNNPQCRYFPHKPFSEVLELFKEALCGLVLFLDTPNNRNGMPNKLFEYMAAGLPVVASHFPVWRQIIEGNQCGLCVNPADPQAIAEAINYYADHPEVARQHGENGRRAVLEKYNWESEARILVEAYKKLLMPDTSKS